MVVNSVKLGESYDIFIDNNIVGNFYKRMGKWTICCYYPVSIEELKVIIPLLESIKK